jgi:hypothetical protein
MAFIHIPNKTNSKFSTTVNIPKQYSMKSIFTSNVFYKPHTNTHVSTSVRHSRLISRKT